MQRILDVIVAAVILVVPALATAVPPLARSPHLYSSRTIA